MAEDLKYPTPTSLTEQVVNLADGIGRSIKTIKAELEGKIGALPVSYDGSQYSNLVSYIGAVQNVLGAASTPAQGTDGEEGYVPAVPASGLFAKVEALEDALGEGGSVDEQINNVIGDISSPAPTYTEADKNEDGKIIGADGQEYNVGDPVVDSEGNPVAGEDRTVSEAIEDAKESAIEESNAYTDEKLGTLIGAEGDDDVTVAEAIAQAKAEAEAYADEKVTSVYKVKGSVATYDALPSEGNVEGDVWNVTAAYDNTPAGTNYVWVGESGEGEDVVAGHWDALGGTVDMSVYQTIEEAMADEEPYDIFLAALNDSNEESGEQP